MDERSEQDTAAGPEPGPPADAVPVTRPKPEGNGDPTTAESTAPGAPGDPGATGDPGPAIDADPSAAGSVPPERADGVGRLRRARKHWVPPQVRWTITVVVLIFVFELVLLPELVKARKTIHHLEQVNLVWLIMGVLLEAISLMAYAELTRTVLSPGPPHRFTLLRINMSSLAVSHVLPGGTAPGTAVAYRLLLDNDVSGSTAAFGLATQGMGSAVVLNAIFWLALLISIPLTGYNPLYGFAAIIGVILLALFAGAVLLLTRGKHYAANTLARFASHLPFVRPEQVSSLVQKIADRLEGLLEDRQLLYHAVIWAAANWLFDAASLWVFIFAFGTTISPLDLLVAYGLVNILAAIPITPGGLGVIEVILPATLVGFHVPANTAFLAVISWRMVNFWLPIPVGGAAYVSLRFGPRARRRRRLSSGETDGAGTPELA